MGTLNITKGKYIEQDYRSYSGAITIRVVRDGFDDTAEDVLTINGYQRTKNEIEGTFKVVLDALNTYNKTPILPSELLKINEELVAFITKFRDERFSKGGSMTGHDYELFTNVIQKLTK